MAIYGIGAYYDEDVSPQFVEANLVGTGWRNEDAPELHTFIRSLKVGDIIYIKAYSPSATAITIRAIGIIIDNCFIGIEDSNGIVQAGRNVRWLETEQFFVAPPTERNNVRRNTLYEEWHPTVQREILQHIIPRFGH